MRYMIDIVHPAHVHFYRHLVAELHGLGHETLVVGRDKEMTLELLDAFGIDHVAIGRAGSNHFVSLGVALIRRVAGLVRLGWSFRPDVVLTRNPAGVIAARLLGATGVFDTDDGRRVGIHWKAAVPFAHIITMPDTITDDHRGRRVAYPSHKALAFLHPARFTPDPSVRSELGVGPDERYSLVRFVAMTASHDRRAVGAPDPLKEELVRRLSEYGRVFISSEGPLPTTLAANAFPVGPERMHDALAFASLLVGDTQSMVIEAALLGVPGVHVSSWHGRLPITTELSGEYGLVFQFPLDAEDELLDKVTALASADRREMWQERRARLLSDKVDLTAWYLDFVLSLPRRGRRRWLGLRRRAPDARADDQAAA